MKKNTQNVQEVLERLLDTYPNESELLAIPHHYTDCGLAKCSRIELQELAEAAPGNPTIVGLGLPVEYVIRIARMTVGLAYLKRNKASNAIIHERTEKYKNMVRSIINGFKEKNATQAQRRANQMTDTQTVDTVETPKATKKAAGSKAKGTKTVKAAKDTKTTKAVAAKPAAKGKKTDAEKQAEFNAAMAKPVKAIRKAAEGELPKQAAIIVNTLKTIGKTTIGALIQALTENGELVTKQPMVAIWSFYRARLINEGFIEVTE